MQKYTEGELGVNERLAPVVALEDNIRRVLEAMDVVDTVRSELGYGGVEILDLEADVMDTGSTRSEELRDRARVLIGAEYLQGETGDGEGLIAKALIGDVFDLGELGTEQLFKKSTRLIEILDGNGDSLDLLYLHPSLTCAALSFE